MQKILAWISRNQAFLLIGFLVIAVGGIFLFRFLTRYLEKTRTTPLPDSALSQFQDMQYVFENLTYTGAVPKFPERLALIKNKMPSVNAPGKATQIAEDLGFIPHESIQNLWVSEDGSKTVRYDSSAQQMRVSLTISTIAPLGESFSDQRAITAAKEYLTNLGLPLYQDALAKVTYLAGDTHGQQTLRREAKLLEVTLTPQVDGIPVIFETNPTSSAIIVLDSTYFISKATFSPLYFAPEKNELLLLIPVDQAVENIKKGSYTVLNVAQKTGDLTFLARFSQVNLRQVYLEYRFIPEFNQLYPYYRFVGVALSREEEPDNTDEDQVQTIESAIEILTPAINTQESAN